MNRKYKRWLILLTGWAFVFLGFIGLFLPFLQGILCLLIGLVILSSEYVWAHKILDKLEKRFPKLANHLHHASERGKSAAKQAGQWRPRTVSTKPDKDETM